MKIYLITPNFYDFDNNNVEIGGVQTYVRDLANLLKSNNYDVIIIQLSQKFPNSQIITSQDGVLIKNYSVALNKQQKVFDKLLESSPDATFILATDQLKIHASCSRSIQIQHGIAFDIPGYMLNGFWRKNKYLQLFNKSLRCLKNVKRLNQTKHTICVDYNYFNWYRTIGTLNSSQQISVIPNYASKALSKDELNTKINNLNGVKRIVFARRFVDYRGTMMFANIVPELLKRFPNLEITFAGDGPLAKNLHALFDETPQIKFEKFDSVNSLEFHRIFDIAIVPTIFSEGTSLSLCEAMAAGCFPIATHVGGMTNILLDGFNGLLCYPSERSLLCAICDAIQMPTNQFVEIVKNAHSCVLTTFSHNHWKELWLKALHNIQING